MHAMLPSISMRSANGLLLHLKEMPSKTQLSFHGKIRIARLMANEPQTHDSTVEDEPTVRPHILQCGCRRSKSTTMSSSTPNRHQMPWPCRMSGIGSPPMYSPASVV